MLKIKYLFSETSWTKCIILLVWLTNFTACNFKSQQSLRVIYVNDSARGLENGASWENAYTSLVEAIEKFDSSHTEIRVAEGTYYPTQAMNRFATFNLKNGIKIIGGYADNPAIRNNRNPNSHKTILSGEIGDTIQTDNSYTVVLIKNCDSTTILDGLMIEGGYADGEAFIHSNGGGIFCEGWGMGSYSSPTIKNCSILNNYALIDGGGIYLSGGSNGNSSPTIMDCTITGNKAGKDGGGLYVSAVLEGVAQPHLDNCQLEKNSAVGSGGALFIHATDKGDGSSTIKNCTFNLNHAAKVGGAIYNLSLGALSSQKITETVFYRNTAYAAGAIYNLASHNGDCTSTIMGCSFIGNYTEGEGGTGGAVYNNGDQGGENFTRLDSCLFLNNKSNYGSDHLRQISASPSISHSIIDARSFDDINSGENAILLSSKVLYLKHPLIKEMFLWLKIIRTINVQF